MKLTKTKIAVVIVIVSIILGWGGYELFVPRPVCCAQRFVVNQKTIDTELKTYKNEKYGFEFKYPGEFVLYVDLKNDISSTSNSWIKFTNPEWPATEIPLPGVEVNLNQDFVPTFIIGEKRTEFISEDSEAVSILVEKKILQQNPEIIELTWSYKGPPTQSYNEYVIINHKNNNKFDYFVPNGIGGIEVARSFKFIKE